MTVLLTVKRIFSKGLLWLAAAAALPLGVIPLFQWLALSSFGSKTFLGMEFLLFMLAVMGAFLTLVTAPFLLLSRSARPFGFQALIVVGILIAAILYGRPLGEEVRMAAFHRLAERSAPLVQAIRAYESRHAAPPASLADLVPEFLPSIPSTGMAAYPHYEYYVGQEAARYDDNPWTLRVNTSKGIFKWDTFMYFPLQNYPANGYGGSIERVADWAYVHE